MKRRWWLLVLTGVVGVPVGLRKVSEVAGRGEADDHLVILSPHHDSICEEFGEAFARDWAGRTGRRVWVDWRRPGGTSEIRMMIEAGYGAASERGQDGMGVDVLFGGGEPDFSYQEKKGRLARLWVKDEHPEWFGMGGVVPQTFTGERYQSADGRWVGVCLSQFGICYNPEVLRRMGVVAPRRWSDLGDPRYEGQIAMADPCKSGSVARAFELLVQSEMQRVMAAGGKVEDGWAAGLRLVQRLAANSRYFTDSASKIPYEVGQGNAAAGMCIDFYGRAYEQEMNRGGVERLVWRAPEGGTTVSADPIAVMKGAEHERVAQGFVSFCLSEKGQRLWDSRVGEAAGPRGHALMRMPIRRDLYREDRRGERSEGLKNPYEDVGNFSYDARLTGKSFQVLRQVIKAMCMDSHVEMKRAWREMIEAGMPAAAEAEFFRLDGLGYEQVGMGDVEWDSGDPVRVAKRTQEVGEWFRERYRRAAMMAREYGSRKGGRE